MNFIKKIVIYGIGNILNKLIIFILLPIYTNNFTPTEYGDNDLALTTSMMLVSLIFMEIWTALLRFSYDETENSGKNKVFSNVLAIILILIPIFVFVSIFVGYWQDIPNIGWMVSYGLSLLIFNIFQFMCRGLGESSYFIVSGIISSLMQLIFSYILIYMLAGGAESMLIAPVIGNFVAAIYLQLKLNLIGRFQFKDISLSYLSLLIKYSLPLSVNSVAYWSMTNLSKYIARNELGADVNGNISVATKFVNIVALIVNIYSLAWQESAYEHSNEKNRDKYYNYMMGIYLDLIFVFTSIIIIGIDLVFPYIIGQGYETAQLLLPIYFISALANAFSTFLGYIFSAEKKTNILLYSTIAGALVNVVILYYVINQIGVISIPLALIIGMVVNIFFRIITIRKTINLNISLRKLAINIFILITACILVYYNFSPIICIMYISLIIIYFLFNYKSNIKTIYKQIKTKITN